MKKLTYKSGNITLEIIDADNDMRMSIENNESIFNLYGQDVQDFINIINESIGWKKLLK